MVHVNMIFQLLHSWTFVYLACLSSVLEACVPFCRFIPVGYILSRPLPFRTVTTLHAVSRGRFDWQLPVTFPSSQDLSTTSFFLLHFLSFFSFGTIPGSSWCYSRLGAWGSSPVVLGRGEPSYGTSILDPGLLYTKNVLIPLCPGAVS